MNEARGLAIVLAAALADVWLAYSGLRSVHLLGFIALLGVLASLVVFFVAILRVALPNPAARAASLFAVVLLGLHPSNVPLLQSPGDVRIVLGLLGVVLGLVLYQHKLGGLLRWIYLAPVASAALCDRVALSFALLLLVYKLLFEESPSWAAVPRTLAQCIPAALVSLLVFVIPGAARSAAQSEPGSAVGALLAFVYPNPSLTGPFPSALEITAVAVLVGIAACSSWRSATRPLAFGMVWFLVMLLAAPNQFFSAYAGLALVTAWVIAEMLTVVRGPRRWLVTAGCALLLVACGTSVMQRNDTSAPSQVGAPSTPASADSQVSPTMTAEQWLNLSLDAYQHHRYLESIAAAQTALKLKPDYAEAYNNIAAAYSELHLWDFAIAAAQEALRIRPDFPLARNNLNWVLEQKRLAAH